jgi:hypothetical protein
MNSRFFTLKFNDFMVIFPSVVELADVGGNELSNEDFL